MSIELSKKVLGFLDSPDWVFNNDLSGIALNVNGKKLSISFECAQSICWDNRVITESIDKSMLKEIRKKGQAIFSILKENRLTRIEKERDELIQTVLKEMG